MTPESGDGFKFADSFPPGKVRSPKLTPGACQVLVLAREEAQKWNQDVVFTQHLLLGCIGLGKGYVAKVLQNSGLDLEILRLEFSKLIEIPTDRMEVAHVTLGPKVLAVLAAAVEEAKTLDRAYVGAEHILLALLREPDGVVVRVLKSLKVDNQKLRQELLDGFEPRSSSQ